LINKIDEVLALDMLRRPPVTETVYKLLTITRELPKANYIKVAISGYKLDMEVLKDYYYKEAGFDDESESLYGVRLVETSKKLDWLRELSTEYVNVLNKELKAVDEK
jgi:hypothetical protein